MNGRDHSDTDISGDFSASSGRAAMMLALRWSRGVLAFASGLLGRAKGVAKTFGRLSADWAQYVIGSIRPVAVRGSPEPITGTETGARRDLARETTRPQPVGSDPAGSLAR